MKVSVDFQAVSNHPTQYVVGIVNYLYTEIISGSRF